MDYKRKRHLHVIKIVSLGLYYLIRGIVVSPASLIGGRPRMLNRQLPFYVAFVVGTIAFMAYAIWGKRERID